MKEPGSICVYEATIRYRRLGHQRAPALESPEAAVLYMAGAFDEDPTVEWFYVILLNTKHRPMGRVLISRGTARSTVVHPREVFRPAFMANSSAIIAVHNHPSGDPAPSRCDHTATKQLRNAAAVLQIDLLDHIIIGDPHSDPTGKGFYSFSETGAL